MRQSYEGVPIYGGQAFVHMTRNHSVYFYTSDLVREAPEAGMSKGELLTTDEAMEALSEKLPWRHRLEGEPHCVQVYFPLGDDLRLAWRIDLCLQAETPIDSDAYRSADWRAIIDAESGEILKLLDITLYATYAYGRVFVPNPVVALQQEGLAWNAAVPDSAYRKVRLGRLDDSGYLRGRYADTQLTTNRAHQADRQFLYDRSQAGFVEVMAYHYVDQVMNWLRRQAWSSLFTQPLRINARAPLGDNSKFLPTSWALQFGEGKVLDAEDASIIVHELGHAIQEAQVTDWAAAKKHAPIRAMGEGFADWLAAVFFAEERRDFHSTYIGDWDARGYKTPRAFLRRVDGGKTMDDWKGEEHADGEIWSAALWDLYLKLGGDSDDEDAREEAAETMIQIVLTSHLYLSDGRRDTLKYEHGLDALVKADRFLGPDPTQPGAHETLIREVFAQRKITI
jgi:hypothetical protein